MPDLEKFERKKKRYKHYKKGYERRHGNVRVIK